MSALKQLLDDVDELRDLVKRTKGVLQTLDVVENHFSKAGGWPEHVAPVSGWRLKELREQLSKCERILSVK